MKIQNNYKENINVNHAVYVGSPLFFLLVNGNFVLKFVEKRVVYGDLEQKGKKERKAWKRKGLVIMRIGRKKVKKVRFHEMRDSLMEDDICKSAGKRGRWRVGEGNRREAFGLSGCADKKEAVFFTRQIACIVP